MFLQPPLGLYLGLGHARWCPSQDGIEPQLHHGDDWLPLSPSILETSPFKGQLW